MYVASILPHKFTMMFFFPQSYQTLRRRDISQLRRSLDACIFTTRTTSKYSFCMEYTHQHAKLFTARYMYICDVLFFLHKAMTTTASLPAQSFPGKPPLYPSFPNTSFLAPFSGYPAMPNTYTYGGGGCNGTTSGLPHLSTSTTAFSALHPTTNFNYADINGHATTNGLISPVGVFH